MKYKNELSILDRLTDQYSGFINTKALQFWSDSAIELFPFQLSSRFSHNLAVPANTVLGKRAEIFFAEAISNSTTYNLLASQIQLIKDGITLGEMDFLVEDIASHKMMHVELAYKFYLLDNQISGDLATWVGPNRRDSLERKWIKLHEFQFPKLYSPTAIYELRKIGCDSHLIQQSLCMPMQLFIPYGESESIMGDFSKCYSGKWLSFQDFDSEKWNDYAFFIPEKEDWFVNPENCEIWLPKVDIISELTAQIQISKSPMLWIKYMDRLPTRLFVTFW